MTEYGSGSGRICATSISAMSTVSLSISSSPSVSFISLLMILDPLLSVLRPDGRLLLMIKPQFEVGRAALGRAGVVRSESLRQEAVDNVSLAAADRGWPLRPSCRAGCPGLAGNVEFFALFARTPLPMPVGTRRT